MWRLQEKGTRPEGKWLGEEVGIIEEKRGNFHPSVFFRVLQKVPRKVIKLIMLERGTRGGEGEEMGKERKRRQ